MAEKYIVIPGTQNKVYDGTVVMLHRLPNLRWILHFGYYSYEGRSQKGWYFSSIPSDTTMPVFNEDLVAMTIIDDPNPCPPGPGPGPFPPGPIPPTPPAPVPTPFTPRDKKHLDQAMLTVETLTDRNKLSRGGNIYDGKIVRVNDIDGQATVEYYSWSAAKNEWIPASLGYRYMTREEITNAIASDIVSIEWSNENGALVITDNARSTKSVPLTGIAHDPIYTAEDLTLRIPVFGKPDMVLEIPRDNYITAIRYEPSWTFPDGSVKPAIVVTVSDGVTSHDIAGDATGMTNIYKGADTATAKVRVSSATNEITADVKISPVVHNSLEIDNEGLLVNLTGYVRKNPIEHNLLLVADGNGGFTYAGTGIEIETTTAISDLTNPEKKVVTANLIADAIAAAVQSLTLTIEERLRQLEGYVEGIDNRTHIGPGTEGEVLVSSGSNIRRSDNTIGGPELSSGDTSAVATESAVKKALAWRFV